MNPIQGTWRKCEGHRPLNVRKIPAPIKLKAALPPPKPQKTTPPPPPLKRGILWTLVFLQKERIFPSAQKIGAAISGPRIADTNFTDTRIFLIMGLFRGAVSTMAGCTKQPVSLNGPLSDLHWAVFPLEYSWETSLPQ